MIFQFPDIAAAVRQPGLVADVVKDGLEEGRLFRRNDIAEPAHQLRSGGGAVLRQKELWIYLYL